MNKFIIAAATLLILLFGAWILWGWLSVKNIEQPKYTVTEVYETFEVRHYDSMILASTTVEGTRDESINEAFRLIADYIFGNNTVKESIAMTSPVTTVENSEPIAMTTPVNTVESEGSTTMSFVMPSQYSMETLPQPVNEQVIIEEVPEADYAVLRFSGLTPENRVLAHYQILLQALEEQGLNHAESYTLSQYNPPWTPWFMRRNEIWVQLTP